MKEVLDLKDVATPTPGDGGGGDTSRDEGLKPPERDQIAVFDCLDFHRKLPDSGEFQDNTRTWERRFDATLRARGVMR